MVELKFPEVLVLSDFGSLVLLSLNRHVPCGQRNSWVKMTLVSQV